MGVIPPPFLRIPPFPGANVDSFRTLDQPAAMPSRGALCEALRRHRVGGRYWLAADAPSTRSAAILVRSERLLEPAQSLASERQEELILDCDDRDPWTLVERHAAVVCEEDDPARLIAVLLHVPVFLGTACRLDDLGLEALEAELTPMASLANPFDGEPMDLLETIELCGFWRRLIESNRDIVGAVGIAFWKQDAIRPLLWDGKQPLNFWRGLPSDLLDGAVAVWRSKASAVALADLERRQVPMIEVEDGFLRSAGLGADCVPPLSVTVDRRGAYFDPAQTSELELLLENGEFGGVLLDRARRLRSVVVEEGIGKYERGRSELPRPGADRRHLLVPGQVEDDRSVMTGGGGLTNLELLHRARSARPDALIIYKPHPDVEAGHRKGAIPADEARSVADLVVNDSPIAPLLDMVDEVHVNTSLAGFEALLRGKAVTTHGVPFYAGWGLTEDLGPVPKRRTRRRSLDELVAATLLVYPRYLDPVTGLPCPAEVVVERLCKAGHRESLLVRLRRLQGRIRRRWQELVAS